MTTIEWTSPLEELTAGQIMNRDVATVSPEATLREVAELLVERRISAVPVVEADGTMAGIVSETDLIDEEKRRVRLPRTMLFGVFPVLEEAVREAYEDGETLTARDMMTRHVITLPEEASARLVADEMVERRVNHIPITRNGRLVGIIARTDLLRAIATTRSARTQAPERREERQ